MIEHGGEHARRIEAGSRAEAINRFADADRRIVEFGGFPERLGPEECHGLGHITHVIAAHVQEDGVDPFLGDGPNGGAFDRGDVEGARQRREAVAAIRVRRFPEIIADQLELGVARARVDEIVEQLRESAHICVTPSP